MGVHIKPLEVEIDGAGKYRHAETVEDLVKLLMGSSWPQGGKQFHSALWRSMEALDSVTEADMPAPRSWMRRMKLECTFSPMIWPRYARPANIKNPAESGGVGVSVDDGKV